MIEELTRYLHAQMPEARDLVITDVARRSGGASRETWGFSAHWAQNGQRQGGEFILRRDPTASVLASDRTREHRVLEAVHRAGLPVPRILWVDLGGEWLQRPSFVMERIPGQAPFGTFPDGYPATVQARVTEQFVDILARIHRLDWRALGLDVLGVPAVGSEPARTQLAHWRHIYAQESLEPHPLLAEAFLWLDAHVPATDRITLVHGDYRSGNYLFTDDGTVTAMLDWEMAHLGDPMEDLGWACMKFWSGRGLAVGLTTRSELLTRYAQASGIPVSEERVTFYEVLGIVKMAAIALTGIRSFCDGKTADTSMAVVGFLLPRLLHDLCEILEVGSSGS